MLKKIISTVTIIASIAAITPACTPSQTAELTQVENTVLNDLKAGKSRTQIEDDIAAIVIPGNAGADIVAILDEAIALLVDSGLLQGVLQPLLGKAVAMRAELAQMKAAGLKH